MHMVTFVRGASYYFIVFKEKNSTLHQKNFSMVMMLLTEQVDND